MCVCFCVCLSLGLDKIRVLQGGDTPYMYELVLHCTAGKHSHRVSCKCPPLFSTCKPKGTTNVYQNNIHTHTSTTGRSTPLSGRLDCSWTSRTQLCRSIGKGCTGRSRCSIYKGTISSITISGTLVFLACQIGHL